jgi:hypothetical protein
MPQGSLIQYQYYTGSKLKYPPVTGTSVQGVYPVICVSHLAQPIPGQVNQIQASKSLYYSFDRWAWDIDPSVGSSTYAQFNMAKEFPSEPFNFVAFELQSGTGSADAPFGHQTVPTFLIDSPSHQPIL